MFRSKPNVAFIIKKRQAIWGKLQNDAFTKIKQELISDRVLAHYNPELTTIVTADAGPAGLGAVLAQRQADGSERVVAYASRSLSKAERNYAQIQKEATAIVFAVKKFHHYLYGRTFPFTLRTDHKPLLSIIGTKKGIPELAANRLQRYALFLSAYNYNIEYVKGENNTADFLSRSVPIENNIEIDDKGIDKSSIVHFISDIFLKPITVNEIRKETERDEILRIVINHLKNGWPRNVNDVKLRPYFLCRLELSLENGCLLRGHKVIIPAVFRDRLLNELHSSHFGIVKIKMEARSRMWWPNIDKQIEEKVGSCSLCTSFRCAPPRAPLAPWPYPERPWERVHLDFFTLHAKNFLIVVDAHSKWIECYPMSSTNSDAVIMKLYELFSRFGLVHTLVTDNATNFTSNQFNNFCISNNIKHVTIAPYHPASNGQAENTVKTVKKALKIILKTESNQRDINVKLLKFLFDYRNSTHCTTGYSPAELMLGRKLLSTLDFLKNTRTSPNSMSLAFAAKAAVNYKQDLQSKQYGGVRNVCFKIGDQVLVKHFYNNGNKYTWHLGIIRNKIGSRLFMVYIPVLNVLIKKHFDQLLKYTGVTCFPKTDDDGPVANSETTLDQVGEKEELLEETESFDSEVQMNVDQNNKSNVGSNSAVGTLPVVDKNNLMLPSEDTPPVSVTAESGRRYPIRKTRNQKFVKL